MQYEEIKDKEKLNALIQLLSELKEAEEEANRVGWIEEDEMEEFISSELM